MPYETGPQVANNLDKERDILLRLERADPRLADRVRVTLESADEANRAADRVLGEAERVLEGESDKPVRLELEPDRIPAGMSDDLDELVDHMGYDVKSVSYHWRAIHAFAESYMRRAFKLAVDTELKAHEDISLKNLESLQQKVRKAFAELDQALESTKTWVRPRKVPPGLPYRHQQPPTGR
jgi:hypothetical protein